jgi:hypothetical protein
MRVLRRINCLFNMRQLGMCTGGRTTTEIIRNRLWFKLMSDGSRVAYKVRHFVMTSATFCSVKRCLFHSVNWTILLNAFFGLLLLKNILIT